MISLETGFSYGGWPNCCRLSNDRVDLVITTDVGPRIIRFGFRDRRNEFCEVAETLGQTGGDAWRLYGGHRLWHAPEEAPRTYFPDNRPVAFSSIPNGVALHANVEETTGIQKEMRVTLDPGAARVTVVHRLINRGLWPVTLAPWALSVMAAGGVGILPLPAGGSHEENLQPGNALVLWPYTDLSDARWRWGRHYVLLHQDQHAATPQKLGAQVTAGWLAYARDNHLFVKRSGHVPGAIYPDRGAAVELFTNALMLELETLGPLQRLDPGGAVEHTEEWFLLDDVPVPTSLADVAAYIRPAIDALFQV
jgi:hypothetical protein